MFLLLLTAYDPVDGIDIPQCSIPPDGQKIIKQLTNKFFSTNIIILDSNYNIFLSFKWGDNNNDEGQVLVEYLYDCLKEIDGLGEIWKDDKVMKPGDNLPEEKEQRDVISLSV